MKLALREMRRRPNRFITATVILTLIALLLMFLGGLLDGLVGNSTSAIEAQRGNVIVFSATSQSSFPSSRLDEQTRSAVVAMPGVDQVAGLSVSQFGARIPGNGPRDLIDVALFGYELAPTGVPEPPPEGEAWADDSLREDGVTEGSTLLLGPARSPIRVAGFVSGLQYNGQATLWSSPTTRREVQNANRPDAREGDGVFQAFVVTADDASTPTDLAARIDAATGGATASLGVTAAANAQPGVSEQRSTFNQIIGVTIVIAIVVVALFFALLIVERTALYGVLKAMGARSSTLFGGVVVQAVVVTAIATTIGAALALLVAGLIPAGSIPFIVTPARILSSVAYLLVAAVIGCAFSLRRVLRIDPASAIGSSS